MLIRWLFTTITISMSATLSVAADNPEFTMWNAHKKGVSITMKTTSEFAGNKSISSITTTLVEKADDKLTLETIIETEVAGNKFKTPAQNRDVPKELKPVAGATPMDAGKKPEGTTNEGEETLKVTAGEYKTKWYEYKTKANGMETETKIWHSDDIPGKVVKMVSKGTNFSTTMELIEFKK